MKKCLLFLLFVGTLFSCDDELKPADGKSAFDSIALLESVLTNHILPEFQEFRADVTTMVVAKNNFVADKTVENLEQLRASYLQSYTSFQAIAKYDFGLAEDLNFYQNLNFHPFNATGIETFILNQENENLGSILTQNRQGFPALDYLLNGLAATDAEIISFFANTNGEDYTAYLSKLVDRIDGLSKQILDNWEGNFGNDFKNQGAFVSIFVNSYIQYFEKHLRSSKIDFPAGKFNGSPSPETIESLYAPEESKNLLVNALESTKLLYTGLNSEQVSLSSVLQGLGEDGLDAKIKLAFLEAENQVAKLDDNLKLQVETDNAEMLRTRDRLQEVILFLKLDLTSAFNISITFQDNDGD